MSIQLGGISFSISLDMPGNPAQRIANLAAALANLQQVASSLSLTQLQTAMRGLGAVGFQGLVASIDRLNLGLRQNTHATLANSQATRQATTATQVQAQATLAAGAAFQQATAQMRNMANASANAANQAHKLQGGFSSAAGAVASFAGVFSGLRLGDWLKDVTLYAGRVENLGTVLRQVGANAHYSTGELAAIEDRVKALGITTQAARQSLTLMARNEMDLKQGGPLARIAQDAAVIAGNNSSEAFEKITLAIQRLDTRMMRNQGILVNLNQEYARFARETGRAATTLTAHEKQQIMLNAVLRAGVNTFGTYEAAMNDAYKQFTSLQRYQEEAMRVAGEQLQGVFSQAVIGATEALKWFTALDENTQRLIVTGAAMGAAFLSAAGAIGACAIAIGALGSAATPVLGIAALLATLAGEYVFLESAAAGVTQRFEKQATAASKAAVQLSQLREVVADLKDYQTTGQLAAVSQGNLNERMAEAVAIMPSLQKELVGVTSANEALARILKAIPEAGMEYPRLLESSLEDANTKVDATVAKFRQLRGAMAPSLEFNADVPYAAQTEMYVEQMRRAMEQGKQLDLGPMLPERKNPPLLDNRGDQREKDLATLRTAYNSAATAMVKYISLQKQAETEELRRLEQMAAQLETSHNLAFRLLDNLEKARRRTAKSTALDMLQENQDYLSGLSSQIMTEGQILKRSELAWKAREANIRENKEKEREEKKLQPGSPEYAQWEKERQEQLLAAQKQEQQRTAEQLRQRSESLQALFAIPKLAKLQIEDLQEENRAIDGMIEARKAGLQAQLVEIEKDVRKTLRENTRAEDEFARILFGDEESKQKAQEYRTELENLNRERAKLADDSPARGVIDARIRELEALIPKEQGGLMEREKQLEKEIGLLKVRVALQEEGGNRENRLKDELLEKMRLLARVQFEIQDADEKRALSAEKTLKTLKLKEEEYREAIRKTREELEQQQTGLSDKYISLAQDRARMYGVEIESLETIRKKIDGLRDGWQKNNEAVRDFLREQDIALLEKERPGFGAVQGLVDRYGEMTQKATSKDQLDQLRKTFGKALDTQLQEARGRYTEGFQRFARGGAGRGEALVEMLKAQQQYRDLQSFAQQARGALEGQIGKQARRIGAEGARMETLKDARDKLETAEGKALGKRIEELDKERGILEKQWRHVESKLRATEETLPALAKEIDFASRLAEVYRKAADARKAAQGENPVGKVEKEGVGALSPQQQELRDWATYFAQMDEWVKEGGKPAAGTDKIMKDGRQRMKELTAEIAGGARGGGAVDDSEALIQLIERPATNQEIFARQLAELRKSRREALRPRTPAEIRERVARQREARKTQWEQDRQFRAGMFAGFGRRGARWEEAGLPRDVGLQIGDIVKGMQDRQIRLHQAVPALKDIKQLVEQEGQQVVGIVNELLSVKEAHTRNVEDAQQALYELGQ